MATTTRNYRTPLGLLRVGARGRGAALTLTIAAGRARGTHTDSPIDARDAATLSRELHDLCDSLMDEHHLSIEVYAPAKHGGFMIEQIDGDTGAE